MWCYMLLPYLKKHFKKTNPYIRLELEKSSPRKCFWLLGFMIYWKNMLINNIYIGDTTHVFNTKCVSRIKWCLKSQLKVNDFLLWHIKFWAMCCRQAKIHGYECLKNYSDERETELTLKNDLWLAVLILPRVANPLHTSTPQNFFCRSQRVLASVLIEFI